MKKGGCSPFECALLVNFLHFVVQKKEKQQQKVGFSLVPVEAAGVKMASLLRYSMSDNELIFFLFLMRRLYARDDRLISSYLIILAESPSL